MMTSIHATGRSHWRRALLASALLVSLLFFAACASDLKRAETLMEGGSYEDAAKIYESILARDPKDANAAVGLRKARLKLVDARLIEIRLMRLAGNPRQALDQLNSLMEKEASWNLFPTGPVAFTQKEEGEYAARFFEVEFGSALAARRPLRASWLLRSHDAFARSLPDPVQSSQASRLSAAGEATCADWRKKAVPSRPYLSNFAKRLCRFYGKDAPLGFDPEAKIASELFSGLALLIPPEQLAEDQRLKLEEDLRKIFRQSPWRSPSGPIAAEVHARAAFSFARSRWPQRLHHSYSVQIPYTDYEDQLRTRSVPYQKTELVYDPVLKTNVTKTVDLAREESYTERVPVTRYRSEPRTFEFDGWRVEQKARLSIEARSVLARGWGAVLGGPLLASNSSMSRGRGGRGLAGGPLGPDAAVAIAAFLEEESAVQTTHDVDMPNIGLSPLPLKFLEKEDWFATRSRRFADSFRIKLDEAWRDRNCEDSSPAFRKFGADEAAIRCARLAGVPSVQLARWFESSLGVEFSAADQMLALSTDRAQ